MMATTSNEKWNLAQAETHLKANLNHKECYGAAIICAALFHKLYGYMPKIGLSGYQGEAALKLSSTLPHTENKEPGEAQQLAFDFEGAAV